MHHLKSILLIVCIIFTQAHPISKTFFMPRLITTDPTIELTLSNYAIYHGLQPFSSFISCFISPFHQKSKNGQHIARYFFPDKKCAISFDEQGNGDISSAWFELVSSNNAFHSELYMRPERTLCGGYINIFFNFKKYCKNIWASITTSVINVDHDLRIRAIPPAQPGIIDGIHSVIDALNNPAWDFGKFSLCSLKKTGLDDIQLKIGYNLFYLDEYHLGIYLVGTIPTGNRPRVHHIFEPIVGSRHGSIGFGINGDLPIYYNSTSEFIFMLDLKYRYLFASKQWRSFDLCRNGDWSRYLLFTTRENTSVSIPGINQLTQQLLIKPRSTLDLWMAVHFARCNFHIEAGYDMWLRVHEKIGSRCPLKPDISIFDLAGAVRGNPISASRATIQDTAFGIHQAPSDLAFIPITREDLNVRSATHPRVLTHKVFGGFAYDNCWGCTKYLIGGATSYEFARTTAALEQVTVWFTFGLQY